MKSHKRFRSPDQFVWPIYKNHMYDKPSKVPNSTHNQEKQITRKQKAFIPHWKRILLFLDFLEINLQVRIPVFYRGAHKSKSGDPEEIVFSFHIFRASPQEPGSFQCLVPETQFSSTRYQYQYVILKDYKGGCKKIIKGYKGINFLYYLIFF